MEHKNVMEILEEMVGKKCVIETTDGSIRTEVVTSIRSQSISVGNDSISVMYPVTVYFTRGEIDGLDLRNIRSIRQQSR